jgi:hypothetical protein
MSANFLWECGLCSRNEGEIGQFGPLSLQQKIPFLARVSETGSIPAWGARSLGDSLHHPVIGIELRPILSRETRRKGRFSNLRKSLNASLTGGMADFSLPSLRRKFPFLAP